MEFTVTITVRMIRAHTTHVSDLFILDMIISKLRG